MLSQTKSAIFLALTLPSSWDQPSLPARIPPASVDAPCKGDSSSTNEKIQKLLEPSRDQEINADLVRLTGHFGKVDKAISRFTELRANDPKEEQESTKKARTLIGESERALHTHISGLPDKSLPMADRVFQAATLSKNAAREEIDRDTQAALKTGDEGSVRDVRHRREDFELSASVIDRAKSVLEARKAHK